MFSEAPLHVFVLVGLRLKGSPHLGHAKGVADWIEEIVRPHAGSYFCFQEIHASPTFREP